MNRAVLEMNVGGCRYSIGPSRILLEFVYGCRGWRLELIGIDG